MILDKILRIWGSFRQDSCLPGKTEDFDGRLRRVLVQFWKAFGQFLKRMVRGLFEGGLFSDIFLKAFMFSRTYCAASICWVYCKLSCKIQIFGTDGRVIRDIFSTLFRMEQRKATGLCLGAETGTMGPTFK